MTKEDLSKLIDECCDDIFDKKEPLVNVKARLYYVLKKQLTLTDVVVPKGTLCEHDYQPDITCGVDITACTKCDDVI
jgi:hypothetical protein